MDPRPSPVRCYFLSLIFQKYNDSWAYIKILFFKKFSNCKVTFGWCPFVSNSAHLWRMQHQCPAFLLYGLPSQRLFDNHVCQRSCSLHPLRSGSGFLFNPLMPSFFQFCDQLAWAPSCDNRSYLSLFFCFNRCGWVNLCVSQRVDLGFFASCFSFLPPTQLSELDGEIECVYGGSNVAQVVTRK